MKCFDMLAASLSLSSYEGYPLQSTWNRLDSFMQVSLTVLSTVQASIPISILFSFTLSFFIVVIFDWTLENPQRLLFFTRSFRDGLKAFVNTFKAAIWGNILRASRSFQLLCQNCRNCFICLLWFGCFFSLLPLAWEYELYFQRLNNFL